MYDGPRRRLEKPAASSHWTSVVATRHADGVDLVLNGPTVRLGAETVRARVFSNMPDSRRGVGGQRDRDVGGGAASGSADGDYLVGGVPILNRSCKVSSSLSNTR